MFGAINSERARIEEGKPFWRNLDPENHWDQPLAVPLPSPVNPIE